MSALPGGHFDAAAHLHGGRRLRPVADAVRLTWRHAEWWSAALSAAAWVVLVAHAGSAATGPTMGSPVGAAMATPQWSHEQHRHAMAAASLTWSAPAWLSDTLHWMLMVAAMMVPLVVGPIRTTAARSLWRRRDRAIAGFLAGYAGLWLVAGLVVSVLLAARRLDDGYGVPFQLWAAMGFALAAAWQLTPYKRRAMLACHRTAPLAPSGWRADRDCGRYGWMIGVRCLASCWALMLACVLAGHSVTAMASTSIVAAAERYDARADQRLTCAVLTGITVLYALGAIR